MNLKAQGRNTPPFCARRSLVQIIFQLSCNSLKKNQINIQIEKCLKQIFFKSFYSIVNSIFVLLKYKTVFSLLLYK